jgi:hypothetical protein
VSGVLAVRGTASDARFNRYSVEIRPDGGTWSLIATNTTPVTNATLAIWNSVTSPDGNYQARLTVTDSLGLSGIVTIPFIVDNEAPFADQTTPVRVRPATGGDVFTTRAEVHLFFPPGAFRDEAIVEILPPDSADACASAIPSAALGGADHLLKWDQPLHKDVLVDIAYAGAGSPATGAAVYRCDAGVWTRVGGTPDPATGRISFATRTQGRYAVLTDAGESVVPSGLAFLSMTPRVFSPSGGFSATDVAIAFSIPRAAGVSVKVFDRSGRLVRTVTDGAAMPAGSNVVRWNGRDLNGEVVPDDLYLIGIEAIGERIIRTVAVVR